MNKVFDKVVGYADFNKVDEPALKRKAEIIHDIVLPHLEKNPPENILVAGCGEGSEAVLLHNTFGSFTVGIDKGLTESSKSENGKVELHPGDISNLEHKDASFDFIYSYHVLEHVEDPDAVLREMRRVITANGAFFVGFPNKNRMVAYVGTHTGETTWDKIRWNLNDYKDRFIGRFENKYGAHAGFAQKPFMKHAAQYFNTVIPVRNEYMVAKYSKYASAIQLMIRTGFSELIFPSNYFILKP